MKFRRDEVPGKELSITEEGSPILTYHYGDIASLPYFHPIYAPNGKVVTADGDVGQQYPSGLCFTLGTIKVSSGVAGQDDQALPRRRNIVKPKPRTGSVKFDLVSSWELPETSLHLVSPCDTAKFGSLALVFLELFTVTVYPLQEAEPRNPDAASIEDFSRSVDKNPGVRVLDVYVGMSGSPVNLTFDGSIGLSYHAVDMEYRKVVDAKGRIGAAEVNGKASEWCTLGGIIDDEPIGVAILPHPANGETRFIAEETSHGFLKAQTSSFTLEVPTTLSLKYRVLIYVGDLFTVDVSDYYQDYTQK